MVDVGLPLESKRKSTCNGEAFERSSRSLTLFQLSWGVTDILVHRVGVSMATSRQNLLDEEECFIGETDSICGNITHQTKSTA